MAGADELVDSTQIVERYGTSKSRISEWSNDPASGFPAVHHLEGRKKFWDATQVEVFFTARERARPRLHVPSAVRRDDPDKLLTKGEVARLLGHKSTSSINNYIRNHPGNFPEPHQDGLYRLGTILTWIDNRPGKGKRTTAEHPPLPKVSAQGDPEELLDTSEVAALLGYSSMKSFSSARSQGNIPELPAPDVRTLGRGGRTQWKRHTAVKAAQDRGTLPRT